MVISARIWMTPLLGTGDTQTGRDFDRCLNHLFQCLPRICQTGMVSVPRRPGKRGRVGWKYIAAPHNFLSSRRKNMGVRAACRLGVGGGGRRRLLVLIAAVITGAVTPHGGVEITDKPLRFGGALLPYGPLEKLRVLGKEPDFVLLNREVQETPRWNKAPLAVLIIAMVLIPVTLGWGIPPARWSWGREDIVSPIISKSACRSPYWRLWWYWECPRSFGRLSSNRQCHCALQWRTSSLPYRNAPSLSIHWSFCRSSIQPLSFFPPNGSLSGVKSKSGLSCTMPKCSWNSVRA